MKNRTSSKIWPRWFWILRIFTFSYGGTCLQTFHSIGESSCFCSPFRNFETHTCEMYAHSTLVICAPPCWASFLHTKSMFLKGELLGFWISIDWNFETQPMFETMPWANYTRKDDKLMSMSKTLYFQYFQLQVNDIFDTNANVHVPSTWFVALVQTLYNYTHNTLNVKYRKYMIWSMAIIVDLKLQYLVHFKSILSMNNLNAIPTWWPTNYTIYGRGKCNTYMTILRCTIYVEVKCNTNIMTLNPHYLWERKMQYLHDNLNMHINICGWQNAILALWS